MTLLTLWGQSKIITSWGQIVASIYFAEKLFHGNFLLVLRFLHKILVEDLGLSEPKTGNGVKCYTTDPILTRHFFTIKYYAKF